MRKYLDYVGLQEFKNNLDLKFEEKIDGKGLSTNDFTTALKDKLDNIEAGATANEGTVTGITIDSIDYIPINGQITLPNYPHVFGASGTNHSSGLVPDPGVTEGTNKYLREDGTWQVPSGSNVTLVADEEDLSISNGIIKFKDRPNTGGMGMVILRKNLVSGVNTLTQSMMPVNTGGNTIYVIQYDFTISGSITVPDNSILRFDGGSISGGTISNLHEVDYSGDSCIFNGVSFTNSSVTLKLDWLMPYKAKAITDTTNVSSMLSSAFNCGVKRIDVTSSYYYYISQTVSITEPDLDIIGDTDFSTNVGNRTPAYMGPCIHTDLPITMIDFEVNVDPVGKERKALIVKGLRLYMHYNYKNVDYSTLTQYQELPLLLIKNGNAGIHKEYIDVYIQGLDSRAKHMLTGIGEYNTGDYILLNEPLFTGIEFRPTNDKTQTFIHVNGILSALYCGVKAMYKGTGTGDWMTDLNMDYDSTALVYGLLTDTGPVVFGGSHQPATTRLEKDYTDAFILVGNRDNINVVITGRIWDLGASVSKDVYNSEDTVYDTIAIYNPIHAASGQIESFKSVPFYYTYYNTSNAYNLQDNLKRSPLNLLIGNMAMSHNYLSRSYMDNVPNMDNELFVLANSQGPDSLGNRIYKMNLSDISIVDANNVSYTEADVFSTGSIYSMFAPKNESSFDVGGQYATWPRIKASFNSDLTINFSVSASKYAYYALTRGLLCATGKNGSTVSVTAVFNDNSTLSLGTTNNPSKGGLLIYSLDEFERYSFVLQKLNFTVTIKSGNTYLPWIGIVGSGIASGYSDGGYLGGFTTIQNAVLKQSEDGFRYKYMPNGKFKDVFVSSTSYVKILELSYLKTGSHLVIKYSGSCGNVFFDINPSSSNVVVTNAENIGIKYEIYSTSINASTKTLVLYAKKLNKDVYLSAEEISTAYNHAIKFENLSDGTLENSGEFGNANMSVMAISADTTSACGITGAINSGKTETIIYTNSGSSDLTVSVPTSFVSPDGQAIELTCPAGGYCEVNYININGTIYARGV